VHKIKRSNQTNPLRRASIAVELMTMAAGRLSALWALTLAVSVASIGLANAGPRQIRASAPVIVKFSADDFWLNLHHFLYVLGRAQNGAADAQRPEVAGAPKEQDALLATLSAADQQRWRDAVGVYAKGLSRSDAISDDKLVAITNALAQIGNATTLDRPAATLPADIADVLRSASPLYRQALWPAHNRSNQRWVADAKVLVDRLGPQVLAFLTRVYQLPWPDAGYPVHVCAFTNWAGAYSTNGPLVVISSYDEGLRGPAALETVFHEASHQWDDAVLAKLQEIGRTLGKKVPDGLTHAMIWMTAGEAVRQVVPGYVPIAEAGGLWLRGANPSLRPSLESAWLPYLKGSGDRDAALTELVKLAGK
jgi:hypothetical protein